MRLKYLILFYYNGHCDISYFFKILNFQNFKFLKFSNPKPLFDTLQILKNFKFNKKEIKLSKFINILGKKLETNFYLKYFMKNVCKNSFQID